MRHENSLVSPFTQKYFLILLRLLGFQKVIGYFDVKTSPVYFHAQKSKSHTAANTVVPFEILRLNLGGGMSTSGIFTAPKSGKYYFT
jgi:hypothetical protein